MNTINRNKQTKVSVIVPTYNCQATIAETIDSVRSQTIIYWELICVDDGSSDNTCKIIETYSRIDGRIKLLKRNRLPKGGSVCRNIGAANASGQYLLFLDSDDLLSADCLSQRLKKIQEGNNDFIVAQYATFTHSVDLFQTRKAEKIPKEKYKCCFAGLVAVWQTMCTFWRKEFFLSIGGFDERFSRLQDIEIHFRALIRSKDNFEVFYSEKPDCFFRLSGWSIQQDVIKKYEMAIDASKQFYFIVASTEELFTPKEYSQSLFLFICNIFYFIRKTNNQVSRYDSVSGGRFEKNLLIPESILYRLIRISGNNMVVLQAVRRMYNYFLKR